MYNIIKTIYGGFIMMTIKQLKSFLDSDDFILFAATGAKKEKQFYKICNSYIYRFFIYLRYKKAFQ